VRGWGHHQGILVDHHRQAFLVDHLQAGDHRQAILVGHRQAFPVTRHHQASCCRRVRPGHQGQNWQQGPTAPRCRHSLQMVRRPWADRHHQAGWGRLLVIMTSGDRMALKVTHQCTLEGLLHMGIIGVQGGRRHQDTPDLHRVSTPTTVARHLAIPVLLGLAVRHLATPVARHQGIQAPAAHHLAPEARRQAQAVLRQMGQSPLEREAAAGATARTATPAIPYPQSVLPLPSKQSQPHGRTWAPWWMRHLRLCNSVVEAGGEAFVSCF